MILYEVSILLEKPSRSTLEWLKAHKEKMLKFSGFKEAKIFHIDGGYVVHYLIDSQKSFEEYCQKGAKDMRAEGERFFQGQKIEITRRILVEIF